MDFTNIKLESSLGETRTLLGYDQCLLSESMISDGTKIILEKKESKKKVQLVDILEDEDEELKQAMEMSLRDEDLVGNHKFYGKDNSCDIEMDTIHVYSEPRKESDDKFLPARADSEAVAERILKSMKEGKTLLGVHQLRRIRKNLMNIWEDYHTWQKQQ